jgi:hypothetical protein
MRGEFEICPHMSTCAMYSLFSYAGTLGAWKARYCTAEFNDCARYQRALDGRTVPINLMPSGALLKKAVGES